MKLAEGGARIAASVAPVHRIDWRFRRLPIDSLATP